MNRMISIFAAWGLSALMVLCIPQVSDALGVRVKAGVSLTREQQFDTFYGMGGQFDSHRWMLGGNLDLGSVMLPKLHLLPGMDIAVQENLRVYAVNLDVVYFFHQTPVGQAYFGGGFWNPLLSPQNSIGRSRVGYGRSVCRASSRRYQNQLKFAIGVSAQIGAHVGLVWRNETHHCR